ncbi:hypothetical protein [Prevotellamassilia timonensis]|uniref:hypothetical protein n=1 Tax=Prevotellamassilia timonensis TaxID=1852370 RepID=UPI001F3D8E4A|nr:hypothetical protein [Prevotellamassilia timonensis]MCF2635020.1 hypothetical protein [Prevotellamassilia timonensis]
MASKSTFVKNIAFADGVESFLPAASSLLPAVSSLLPADLLITVRRAVSDAP